MEKRETETIEFKKSTGELKEAVISLASMLNKNGYGTVYFGIKNNGAVVGQQIGDLTTADISRAVKDNIKPRVTPRISIIEAEGKNVIEVKVYGEDIPYSAYNRYYIRSDDEDNIMTTKQLEEFFVSRNYTYDGWEKADSGYSMECVDEELLRDYVRKGNDCGRINFVYKDAKTTLMRLKLLCGENLNNAGYYLFSDQKPLLLKLAIYPTEERISFSDMRHFRGNIFECINEAVKYVTNNIHWRAEIKGMERVETPEIPLEAFREIIVNSFAHMRVNEVSANEIYITPSVIHIYNPGALVPGTDPMMFAERIQGSMIRNPLIAMVMYYNRTIDAFGTGFERVFKLCREINYRYDSNQFGFTFEFLRQNANKTIYSVESSAMFVNENSGINNLSRDESNVYNLIKTGKRFTQQDFADRIGKSVQTVQRIIRKMTANNLIKRVGARKDGYWVVV